SRCLSHLARYRSDRFPAHLFRESEGQPKGSRQQALPSFFASLPPQAEALLCIAHVQHSASVNFITEAGKGQSVPLDYQGSAGRNMTVRRKTYCCRAGAGGGQPLEGSGFPLLPPQGWGRLRQGKLAAEGC